MGLTELDLSEVKMPGGNIERRGCWTLSSDKGLSFVTYTGRDLSFLHCQQGCWHSLQEKKKMTLQGMEINSEPLSPEGENAVAPPSGRLADTCGLWGGVCAPSISSGFTSTHNSTSLPGEPVVFAWDGEHSLGERWDQRTSFSHWKPLAGRETTPAGLGVGLLSLLGPLPSSHKGQMKMDTRGGNAAGGDSLSSPLEFACDSTAFTLR